MAKPPWVYWQPRRAATFRNRPQNPFARAAFTLGGEEGKPESEQFFVQHWDTNFQTFPHACCIHLK